MLQWMGGSRRKVTTSRQSMQKRQKQYFEQRKRQQQKQQTGAESFADGTNFCTHQDNNRSLDILSLLNLSTVVQKYNSSSNGARENLEGGDVMLDCHTSKGQPILQAAKVIPGEPAEFREQGYPLGCQVESVYSKKVLSGDHDIQTIGLTAHDKRRGKLKLGNEHCYLSGCQTETKCEKKAPEGEMLESIRGGDRRDKLKTASGQRLSVFDLLGDDGPNGNYEENPSPEAHMAFVMEGLGEMGTETPVHSPECPARILSYGPVSPIKAPKQSQISKNTNSFLHDLELEAAAVTQNTDLPLYGSSIEPPFFSEDIRNSFNKTKDLFSRNDSWRFINNDGKLKNSFADDEILWEIDNRIDDN